MKIIRSSKCSFKFLTNKKQQLLKDILQEYSRVVNFFIDNFWNDKLPKKSELLKSIVDLPNSWMSARLRKVAAREAIDLIKSVKKKKDGTMPIHSGKSMHVSSTTASLQAPKKASEFDAWLHLASIGNQVILDIPVRMHRHINELIARGKRLESYIIRKDSVQFCFAIETGPKKAKGELVGIDTNLAPLAALSNGKEEGKDIGKLIQVIKRKQHGSNKQKKARRSLRQRIDEVAKKAVKDKRLIVTEALKKMNYKTKLTRRVSKNIRRSLGAWNYRYWLSRLQMSCEDNRVAFRSVPAYYTSQRCPVCGHTERKNRNLDEFKCQECDYAGNAHTIAGCNILLRFLSGPYGAAYKPKDLGSLIPKFS